MSIKPWNKDRLFAVPRVWDATSELELALSTGRLYQTEGEKAYSRCPRHIKPIWIEGDKHSGRPTRHFCWVGLPKGVGTGKVPAVVLVHGGGGTAFLRWVEAWNRRGYAAIAVDTCGHLPVANEYGKWANHDYACDWVHGDFYNAEKPPREQWCYHAITAVVRAHSYLLSLSEVDKHRTGITGISWGGYLTSIASSLDCRFSFAAPVYGCGFLKHDSPWQTDLEAIGEKAAKHWLRLWDPGQYLPNSKVPTLWATGSNDKAYNLDMLRLSAAACGANVLLSIHVRYPHSHRQGWRLLEPNAFADSFCLDGPKLEQPQVKINGRIVEITSDNARKATLCYTKDRGKMHERFWKQGKMATASKGRFFTELPDNTTAWFVNVIDQAGNVLSGLPEIVGAGGQ